MSSFRPATISDRSRMIMLLQQVGTRDFRELTEEILRDLLEQPTLHPFVLEDEAGLVIGMAVLTVMPNLKHDRRGYVDYVVVDRSFRKRGFGHMIMDGLEVAARELGCDHTLLTTSDPIAQGLYQEHNFVPRPESLSMKFSLAR